jgi:hypothetical protein
MISNPLVRKFDLFRDDPTLIVSAHTLTSQVCLSDFRIFVSALEGVSVPITNNNMGASHGCARHSILEHWPNVFHGFAKASLGGRGTNAAARLRDCSVADRTSQHLRVQESTSEAVLGSDDNGLLRPSCRLSTQISAPGRCADSSA